MGHRVESVLAADASFEHLAARIKVLADGHDVDFYPSPGNWGDSLINAGSRDFFAAFGVSYRSLARADAPMVPGAEAVQRLAVVGGGGGWNRNWNSSIGFTFELSERYRAVLVLPSTYDPELARSLTASNVTMVARGKGPSSAVADLMCHDMAFFADFGIESQRKLPYPLIALRRDKERSHESVSPDRNWDLSLLGDATHSHKGLLDLICRFPSIYTDRLHIAIAGAVLGLEVHLLDGNYGKNAEVFDLSLRENFSKVTLSAWRDINWSDLTGFNPIGHSGYDGGVSHG